jgi:hypothetical protein
MLTAADNNDISDRAPDNYFGVIPEEHRESVLDSALIPKDGRNGALPYETFLKERAGLLARFASSLIDG